MGKIDRIQLRGISRTPSDRMTADGGCAESLNLYIDNDESAPAIMPEDVTGELGLPDDLQDSVLFIHKTSNYENVITRDGGVVYAYTESGKQKVSAVGADEELIDIKSIGNTLIVATSKKTSYVLYKDKTYLEIEGGFPKVAMSFVNYDVLAGNGELGSNDGKGWNDYDVTLEGKPPIQLGEEENGYRVTDETGLEALHEISNAYQLLVSHNLSLGMLCAPAFLMYGIRLYDGSLVNLSSPVMVGSKFVQRNGEAYQSPLQVRLQTKTNADNDRSYDHTLSLTTMNPYRIGIYKFLDESDVTRWKDIVSSVDVFISPMVRVLPNIETIACFGEETDTYKTIVLDPVTMNNEQQLENAVMQASEFYLIKSYTLDQLAVFAPNKADIINDDLTESLLVSGHEHLYDNAISPNNAVLSKMLPFNNRLISFGGALQLSHGNPYLNGQYASANEVPYEYQFRYHISSQSSGSLSIISRDEEGMYYINPSYGEYYGKAGQMVSISKGICGAYAWLSYPDSRCTKVDILCKRMTDEKVLGMATLEMKGHPFVPNSSYAFIGFNKSLADLEYDPRITDFDLYEDLVEKTPNKLLVSKADNPFVYPNEGRITLSSPIVGGAIATTALSQGQFGQFPLYVFTEDGIWAMETAADGSFITSKPLSRDVCINPESITAIDSAVVFVTDKGVMFLQGSQVLNISPNMNGRHYTIESTVETIVEGQEFFRDLIPVLTDSTHFLAFVRKAKIAYDYPGKRLIFIKEDEKYQYIYKLDTDTWHKTAYGLDLLAPVNSYPECLVQGKGPAEKKTYIVLVANESQEEWHYLADRIRVKLPDVRDEDIDAFLEGEGKLDVTALSEDDQEWLFNELDYYHLVLSWEEEEIITTRIYDLSTILDAVESKTPMRGVIATRPFDLQAPDVLKTITDIQIRGQYARGAVKFMLLGSMDGIHYYVIGTKRGKAWKLFRLVILADLEPTERVSWVDVEYETKFTNRLR